MEQLSNKQLNMRIESFITRKHQQYPELHLAREKAPDSIGYLLTGKVSEFISSLKTARLAH